MLFKFRHLYILIVTGSATCPSTVCWDYNDETGECVLKSDDDPNCFHITCGADEMTVAFTSALFGTEDNPTVNPFVQANPDCLPKWDETLHYWQFTSSLGDCEMVLGRKTGLGDKKYITFTTLMERTAVATTLNGITLHTVDSWTIPFTCKYLSTASSTADEISVRQLSEISGAAVEQEGTLDAGLVLEYFNDDTFLNQQSFHNQIYLGSTLFVQATWSLNTLRDKIKYYIKDCSVKSTMYAQMSVKIVADSCYASAIQATYLSPEKLVEQSSRFSYTSFAFDISATDAQELACDIVFCLLNADDTSDCDDDIPTLDDDCPDDPHSGFQYRVGFAV